MLVLSRKVGEEIRIGEQITVRIVRIGPHAVRVGVVAPAEQPIVRVELLRETTRKDRVA